MKKSSRLNRSRWLALAACLMILVVAAYFWKAKKQAKAPTSKYRPVVVQKQDIDITILSTGVVQPENRLEIKPPIAGRVEEVLAQEGQLVKKGQILAWMSSTERAALLDAARSKGAEELRRWEELYRPTPIIAPLPGTIILRNVEAGQTFSAVDSVFVMSNRLTIKAQVDETDLSQIKKGQKASVTLDAYPKESIEARVERLAYDSKTVNNVTTYTVDVLPLSTPEFMRSGMTANVSFQVESKPEVLALANEAIKLRDNQAFVLKPNTSKPEEPSEVAIKIGISDGKVTEVLSGLVDQEQVLVLDVNLSGEGKPQANNPFMPFGNAPKKGSK